MHANKTEIQKKKVGKEIRVIIEMKYFYHA